MSESLAADDGGSDNLVDQWAYLDAMVERQASKLRAGIQDEEELIPALDEGAAHAAQRVQELEQECDALSTQLAARGRELERRVAEETRAATGEITAKLEQTERALGEWQARYRQLDELLRAAKQHVETLQTQLSITESTAARQAAPRRRWWHRR